MTDTPTTHELLNQASNEDLEPLVGYIKNATISEWLTTKDEYKENYPNHVKYASQIYDEICLFGGNTFANLCRGGRGPEYQEVLGDAAEKVGVKAIKGLDVQQLEQAMLEYILRKALKKAEKDGDESLRKKLFEEGMNDKAYNSFLSGGSLAAILVAVTYRDVIARSSVYIAQLVAQRLLASTATMSAAFVAERAGAAFLGPIAWVVAGIWTTIDIAGPAFRVTVPCTLHIAMLRQKWLCDRAAAPLREAFDD